ncbi:MAG: hypothetical protein ISS52_01620 [Dehalococcoidia bacterium]|nr:hypothetical protein [Dehalococcoidia bacterium]
MTYIQDKLVDKGPSKLSELELLALILSNEQAAEGIIRDFGSLAGLVNHPLEKFLRYKGLGGAKIIQLAACYEIACRLLQQRPED